MLLTAAADSKNDLVAKKFLQQSDQTQSLNDLKAKNLSFDHITLVKKKVAGSQQEPHGQMARDEETKLADVTVIGQVDPEEYEAISNMTFTQLIEEAAKVKQSLLIARVQTRDKANFRKKYYHHFYGPSLIKILFKTFQMPNEQILRSRYHSEFPLTAKDPLTNEVIVGEVEFFLIDHRDIAGAFTDFPQKDQHRSGADASPEAKIKLTASFFGSDFNYATSKGYRKRFAKNTQDKDLLQIGFNADRHFLVDNSEAPSARDDNQAYGPEDDEVNEPAESDQNIAQGLGIDEQAFLEFMYNLQANAAMGYDVAQALKAQLQSRCRALDFYGKVMFFFFLASSMSFYVAAKNFYYSSDEEYRIELDLFTYLLPFVSFIIDASVKRAYCLHAKSVYIGLKIILIFYYLCVYVIALQRTPDSQFYWIANSNLIAFPSLIIAYWYGLIHGKLS